MKLRRKTTKVIKLQWIASIWCQKDQTNAKLQKWYYFDEFGSIWSQNDQNFEVTSHKTKVIKFQWIASIWHQNNQNCWVTSKNIQNYAKLQNDQIIVHCIDLTSKRSKTLRYVAKLQKWSNYNELHRLDVKTIKTFELGRKTKKVIK